MNHNGAYSNDKLGESLLAARRVIERIVPRRFPGDLGSDLFGDTALEVWSEICQRDCGPSVELGLSERALWRRARWRWLDRLRRDKKAARCVRVAAVDPDTVEDRHGARNLRAAADLGRLKAVQEALGHLSLRDREIVERRVYSEQSYKEIGAALGMNAKTVQTTFYRLQFRLRRELQALEPARAERA